MKVSWQSALLCRLSLCILGVATVLLPWFQLSILGGTSVIRGYDVWQGKVVLALLAAFAVALLSSLFYSPARRWQTAGSLLVGAALLGFSGAYILQIIHPAPARINVQHADDVANWLTQQLVKGLHGRLSFGAPLGVVVGLGLMLTVSLRSRGRG